MNNKNVIINVRSASPVKILESRTEGSDLYLVGEFTTFDVMNRNKRIYKKDNYKAVLEQIADKCASGGLLGELGHPSGRNTTEMTAVSHVVTKLEIDDANNCVRGELKLLDTPNGKIARTLIESGVPMFVSSRASGYIGKGGVVTLTNLVTYDLVDEPGFANARLTVRDITEGLCSECDDMDNVAVFACDTDTSCVPSCEPDKDDDIKSLIRNLTVEVKNLSARVANCEAKCSTNKLSVQAPANIENIIDSRVAEGLDDIRDLVYSLDEKRLKRDGKGSCGSDDSQYKKYMNYVAEQYNKDMGNVVGYLEYLSKAINEGQAGGTDSNTAKRLNIIESYLEEVGLAYNKTEKDLNAKFRKLADYADYTAKTINENESTLKAFVSYADYIAKTINENNAEVNMMQEYLDSAAMEVSIMQRYLDESAKELNLVEAYLDTDVVNAIENINEKNSSIASEIREGIKRFDKIDTRLNHFTESVSERMDALDTVSNTSDMTDIKKLLENIQKRENIETQRINANAQAQRENMFLEREEKRLLSFMHPSVKHIWEGLDESVKMKIASDMSASKCLAVQAQSLMLTRLINNHNLNK